MAHILIVNSSNREKEIILHPFSCFVLGRSGTGYAVSPLDTSRVDPSIQEDNNDVIQDARSGTSFS
jgi:hypothetical protein